MIRNCGGNGNRSVRSILYVRGKAFTKSRLNVELCIFDVTVLLLGTIWEKIHELRMASGPPFDLSVKRYLPRVKDFERDAAGGLEWSSLQGPERIEVGA